MALLAVIGLLLAGCAGGAEAVAPTTPSSKPKPTKTAIATPPPPAGPTQAGETTNICLGGLPDEYPPGHYVDIRQVEVSREDGAIRLTFDFSSITYFAEPVLNLDQVEVKRHSPIMIMMPYASESPAAEGMVIATRTIDSDGWIVTHQVPGDGESVLDAASVAVRVNRARLTFPADVSPAFSGDFEWKAAIGIGALDVYTCPVEAGIGDYLHFKSA